MGHEALLNAAASNELEAGEARELKLYICGRLLSESGGKSSGAAAHASSLPGFA